MRWPSDSATEHLRRCIPWSGLESAGYSYQFGVNPEIVTTLVAAEAKRSDVEFVSPKHLLNVGTYERSFGMAIGSTAAGGLFTRLLFPILQPWVLSCRGLWPSGSTTCVFDVCHRAGMVLDAVVWTVQQSFTPVGGSGAQERVHHLEKEQILCQFLKFEQKPQN